MSLALAELFDAEFLESLQRLRIVARRVPKGGRFAEQRSRALGAGIEFQDYRSYVAGDDLRAIDWNLYRRHRKVFLRLFEELEDLPIYLLPDVSESMWLEDPPRARTALRGALAFAAVALGQHDRVGIFPMAGDLDVGMRPTSGRGQLMTLARRLAAVEPQPETDLARALHRLDGMQLRRGLVVVLSDFFDPRGLEPVLAGLKRVRHRLLLAPVTRASDREPDLEGDLRVVDCETGDHADVSIDASVRERYRAAYDRYFDGLAEFARRRGAGFLPLDADREVVPQLAKLFESGSFEA